MRTGIVR